jgi:nucleotide-binding universal stress UspA family protein
MAGTIVLGYDGTDCAKAALDVACKLASETGAEIIVSYGYGPHRAALRERGEELTGEALAVARERSIEATVEMIDDRPAPALASLAEARGADYIVIGSYGEKPLTGAILGSTPHKLLHMSPVPVIVVPAGD